MKNDLNVMILNNVNNGISKIELDKSDLRITDKSGKYCLQVCVEFNWKDINNIRVGEKKNIDFNEYCFSENNEAALILPTSCYVEKVSENSLYFNMHFGDLANETHYMNKRGYFDVELNSLECRIFIDYNDATKGFIIYNFVNSINKKD